MEEKSLWQQFNLREDNPHPGRGILYCLKYSKERLTTHQERVISSLQSRGVELRDNGKGIDAKINGEGVLSELDRVYELLGRLSCVNEALEYIEVGLGQYRSLGELKIGMTIQYYSLLEEDRLADAYNLVDMFIPRIIRDIKTEEERKVTLNKDENTALEELSKFAINQINALNHPGGVALFGR
jgi:hypothetical protein